MPAYLKGFEEENKEIDAIINNSKEPTFKEYNKSNAIHRGTAR